MFGLWIEPEIVGIRCEEMLAYYDDDCFLQRNGRRIAVMNRYFLDFRHEKVRGYMTETIRRMVEDGRDCTEVLVQLSAVKAAINNTGKVILQDHIEHCIVDAVESGDKEALEELNLAIDRFIK